jgi:galactokinase
MNPVSELKEQFRQRYGAEARVYRAPGRVNLIGEHTDYNDGFVMPAAIGFSTWVGVALRPDRRLAVYSEAFSEGREFDLDDADPRAGHHWSDYVRGMAVTLERAGYRLSGANLLIRSEVPIGSGLSSSAALEIAAGYALLDAVGIAVARTELARIGQRSENEFVGARCGIMDQFIACHGRAGHALLLDCRSLEYRLLPLIDDVKLVVCNTMVRHGLAGGEYNVRRAQCEAGARHLAGPLPPVRALRDATLADLETHGRGLSDVVYRRCRHVISENARTEAAAAALECGDLVRFGQLMNESHRSLRDDYEVSCEELDLMVELARQVEGVYGARMTGGGFGGCTVNLVEAESVAQFEQVVTEGYEQATGRKPEVYVCTAAGGAERANPNAECGMRNAK